MAHKLFIGGLAFSTSDDRLREVFTQAGGVESAAVVKDRDTGQSRGFGFVEMESAEAAAEAVSKFNGQTVDGRTLKVEIANSKGAGGGAGGGGFRSRGSGGRQWKPGGVIAGRSRLDPREPGLALADRRLFGGDDRGVARDLPLDRGGGGARVEAAQRDERG